MSGLLIWNVAENHDWFSYGHSSSWKSLGFSRSRSSFRGFDEFAKSSRQVAKFGTFDVFRLIWSYISPKYFKLAGAENNADAQFD
jgi:hypothetical protein